MESSICCPLYKALTLDPVPVIGDMIYVPGAEGLGLRGLRGIRKACTAHRYNFKHTVELLLRQASKKTQCSCESSSHVHQPTEGLDRPTVSPSAHGEGPLQRARGAGRGGVNTTKKILWAYEIDNVVTAYRWLNQNRCKYPKGCDAVIVYQLKSSQSLPPGLYVYRTRPCHFGCTAERPLVVIDQFNFKCRYTGLPKVITIEMFPGRESFSALYVITRKLPIPIPEYGNRMFGEARALGLIESCPTMNAIACNHHEVAMRTEQVCVIDLRWKGFETKTACIKAIPRVRELSAVVWSNHFGNVEEIEHKVLTWLFGLSNDLPQEVQLIDHKREGLGVRYILMDTDTFPGVIPKPPDTNECFFVHTHFMGDMTLARTAIGELTGTRSRMGSPCPKGSEFAFWYSLHAMVCQPTPFSCGVRHRRMPDFTEEFKGSLLEWTLAHDGTSCLAIAVQHTLFYHARERKYKILVTHTVMDKDNTLAIFRL